ncbi:MAG: hypothetical protein ICCCNLDF_02517 [Planctomycetes bacterium]|nr:hypothetical protein [Planctomycetota bacterium]
MSESNPRPPRWFQWYMYLVGIGGNLFFYIQSWEIFTRRSAGDVSLVAFSVALWAVTSWFVYGLFLRNPVLIIANIVGMLGAASVVTGKLMYG